MLKQSRKATRDLVDATELLPEREGIKKSLARVERALSSNPNNARHFFKFMLTSIQLEKEGEKKAREERLAELTAARG